MRKRKERMTEGKSSVVSLLSRHEERKEREKKRSRSRPGSILRVRLSRRAGLLVLCSSYFIFMHIGVIADAVHDSFN